MREEIIGEARLILGDCREVLPTLGKVDAVVTDPPYGIDYDPRRSQSSAASGFRKEASRIVGDAEPFSPSHLIAVGAPRNVIWGANYFASSLPDAGGWLIWDKRDGGSLFRGFKMSDCEIAWCDVGRMVRTISHKWCGHLRDSERDLFVHPTQKATAVMEWCLVEAGTEPGHLVLDPYMGSGTTGVACLNLGRRFVGIEIDPEHFETAVRRIEAAHKQPRLFDEPPPKPVQEALL